MNRKTLIIGISVLVGLLAVGGGIWFWLGRGDSGKDKNVVYVNSVESLMNPGSGNGSVNRFAGVVETQEKLDIQPSQEKTVKEVYVEEGQEVQVGTPLFIYDTEKAEEDLSKAQLDLERINNTIGNKSNEIAALEKEKRKADKDSQLDYTMQIQGSQMELKQSEYEKKSKQVEIQKLQDTIENAVVSSELAGVVKSINKGNNEISYGGESQAFMTIIAMGDFRIKGKVNETNMGSILTGQPVIVHSRIDEDVTWKGTMGEIDTNNPGNDSGNGYYFSSGDATTQSNSYPFYVNLDSSEGLMLGQHVYIEMDYGQEEEKAGIWLDDSFICDVDSEPYVWADNGKGKLEKRSVALGQHDDDLFQYEIADGLTQEDLLTYPEEGLEEGMTTAKGENGQMGQSNPPGMEDGENNLGEEGLDGSQGEMLEGDVPDGTMLDGGEIIGGSTDESGGSGAVSLPEGESDGAAGQDIPGGTEDVQ